MSNSSLGYSFIESTDKIKEKLKPKMKMTKSKLAALPKAPVAPVEETNIPEGYDDSDVESHDGLADVDFAPPPKPESTGVQRTKDKEKALSRTEQHPAEPFTAMGEENATKYYQQYIPFESPKLNTGQPEQGSGSGTSRPSNELEEKLNYLIHMMEDQKDEKVNGITEEIVLYCFLGVFIIFVLDSFAKVGKYVR